MSDVEIKKAIEQSLNAFTQPISMGGNFHSRARALFETLGYRSARRLDLEPITAETFLETFDPSRKLNPDNALLGNWESIDLLFQLTDEEIKNTGQARLPFDSSRLCNFFSVN